MVVALHDAQRVAFDVLARDVPRRVLAAAARRAVLDAADAEALALAEGVEGQADVCAETRPRSSWIGPGSWPR